tara:strand:+ start:330 stop:611 length:282 start_codon:yes stop_codon:yes gene_type:complete
MEFDIETLPSQFAPGDIVWVPKIAVALWSRPGSDLTEGLWNIGIIMDMDNEGNTKIYVDGEYEYLHTNFIRPMDKHLLVHPKGRFSAGGTCKQ